MWLKAYPAVVETPRLFGGSAIDLAVIPVSSDPDGAAPAIRL